MISKITFSNLELYSQIDLNFDNDYMFYSVIRSKIKTTVWNNYLGLLPRSLQFDVMKYYRWEDRHNSLIGKLLVYTGYKLFYGRNLNFDHLLRDNYGKPFLKERDFEFNISHSNRMVSCAFSNQLIGIDIEQLKDYTVENFDSIFSNEELLRLKQNKMLFFDFWTTKEAVVKADGRGLSIPLLDIQVYDSFAVYNNINWFKRKIINEDYYCTLVSQTKKKKLNLIEVEF